MDIVERAERLGREERREAALADEEGSELAALLQEWSAVPETMAPLWPMISTRTG